MQKNLVFDIGCHNGNDSAAYMRDGYSVVAIEAAPRLCTLLRNRFADEITSGRFTLVDRAIAVDERGVEFYSFPEMDDGWGTISAEWAASRERRGAKAERVIVPSVRFESLIEQYGMPYYLKIDIEGADHFCLDALSQFNERPEFISTEIESRHVIGTLTNQLSDLGYRKFRMVDQANLPEHTSGQFDTGPWISRGAVKAQYYATAIYNRIERNFSRRSHWYDLHASR